MLPLEAGTLAVTYFMSFTVAATITDNNKMIERLTNNKNLMTLT